MLFFGMTRLCTFVIEFFILISKKIVITGGPSTGKTAVINALEAAGYTCLHEIIRTMTAMEKDSNHEQQFTSNPIVSVADPKAFNQAILEARISQYESIQKTNQKFIFFDRGIPDVLAYMDCFEQSYDNSYTKACLDHRYGFIFLMPPWKAIHRVDSERFETYDESLKVYQCLHSTYTSLGYQVIEVPKDSIANRVAFILAHINSKK